VTNIEQPSEYYTDLRSLDEPVLICKALWGHEWENNPSPQHIDGQVARLAHRMLCIRCTRCGRERYDYIGRNGDLIGRYYKNPNGYPKTHRFGGDELRLELIRRNVLVQRYSARARKANGD
jgi:hypothetical protein